MTETHKHIAFATGIMVLAGALLAGCASDSTYQDGDDDRPPIIVRGGSLLFVSGDEKSADPKEQKGKPWKKNADKWQPDHPKGKPATEFTVTFDPTSTACPASSTTEKVTVRHDGQTFSIDIQNDAGGKKAPTITGPDLKAGGTADNPAVVYDNNATNAVIDTVEFTTTGGQAVSCATPTWVKVTPKA